MKRRRETSYRTQIRNTDELIQITGPSISDLPTTIIVDILLKLCTKSITFCKCVCKSWHSLISDPQFAKLHLKQAKPCLLIRDTQLSRISRALYLLEPEDVCIFDTDLCESVKKKHNSCCFNIKVKGKLKMPLRNAQVMLSQVADDMNVSFGIKNNWKGKHLIELESVWHHKYWIQNSCNGLLCLVGINTYDLVVVCNPILGEFIYLPQSSNSSSARCFNVGLGFCSKNNQYKVIRVFLCQIKEPATGTFMRLGAKMAEIHTLGTDSWRSVDISAFELDLKFKPIYLNGALHWICRKDGSQCIVSFDLDKEQFHFYSIPSPPCEQRKDLAMGVLGGCLCVYYSWVYDHIDIWVMKDYGVCNSWTNLFSMDIANDQGLPHGYSFKPISYLSNGALLMFRYTRNDFIYYDELRGLRFKHLKFRGIKSVFGTVVHTPSFISLKEIVLAANVEVLNVNSRCGKLRLVEENYPLVFGRTRKTPGDGFF